MVRSIVLRLSNEGKLIKISLLEQDRSIRLEFQLSPRKPNIKKLFYTDSIRSALILRSFSERSCFCLALRSLLLFVHKPSGLNSYFPTFI